MHDLKADGAVGCLDLLTADRLEGWVWRPDRPDRPVSVQLLLDGWIVRSVDATRYRPDLEKAGIGNGRHGFVLPILAQDMEQRPRTLKVALDEIVIEDFSVPIANLNVMETNIAMRLLFGALFSQRGQGGWN
ncbi:hypothetical protein GAY29_30030 [Azospirillum brasilense]|uniref:hypothetical protein n=1 Tax=Azospirillum brasilense TaxID=192 RepID=UPI001909F738|nr:hypothetical protein [Azospirillum brasilense]MBK3737219.1 hypothetical protein [Azospirillum brasilense]